MLAKVDPCKLMTADELQQHNFKTTGDPMNSSDETGCLFSGVYPAPDLTLAKSKDSVDDYVNRSSSYKKLVKNSVNGRNGVQVQISSSNDECSQVLAVGSGDVVVALAGDKSGDPCGDAAKLAQLVEPRLPK